MFKNQDYMNQEQQSIAKDFMSMVEAEYATCATEIRRAKNAIITSPTELNDEENRKIDFANREIDSVQSYWQLRLGHLIDFLDTKNPKLNEELAIKYLAIK